MTKIYAVSCFKKSIDDNVTWDKVSFRASLLVFMTFFVCLINQNFDRIYAIQVYVMLFIVISVMTILCGFIYHCIHDDQNNCIPTN